MSYHEAILNRDDETCQICGTRSNLHVHHIVFRSQGGTDDHDNLITLCEKDHRLHAHGIEAKKYQDLFKQIIKQTYEPKNLLEMFEETFFD